MNLRRALPLLAGLGLLALEARGDAPALQYVTFNRDDVTITDQKTALVWERNALVNTAGNATTYCNGLKLNGLPARLPTVKELLTLVDELPHDEFDGPRAIDRNAFPATVTTVPFLALRSDPSRDWVVHFDTGTAESVSAYPPQAPVAVRCVYAKP
jgi:hypothetical protein